MGILNKIFTAIRGGAREVGEGIVDANGIRIMEQELHDASNELKKAKHNLTGVMAQQMQAERKVNEMKSSVSEHEGYATQALEQGNEALALEIAEKIAGLENELAEQVGIFDQYASQSQKLKEIVKRTEKTINEHKRQLSMVKTTENVQKASRAISDSFDNSVSKLSTAKSSLERIKQRQQDFDDREKAASELKSEEDGGDLMAKLKDAGISGQNKSAQNVLDRLKNK